MLEYLEEANLFTSALDEDRSWYRYHHLFAEVLQHRQRKLTGAAHVAKIYRHACAWYKQVSNILMKLAATNRTQAVARAREQGWLSSEM